MELADVQLYGFTILFSVFTLYEADVSELITYNMDMIQYN